MEKVRNSKKLLILFHTNKVKKWDKCGHLSHYFMLIEAERIKVR